MTSRQFTDSHLTQGEELHRSMYDKLTIMFRLSHLFMNGCGGYDPPKHSHLLANQEPVSMHKKDNESKEHKTWKQNYYLRLE